MQAMPTYPPKAVCIYICLLKLKSTTSTCNIACTKKTYGSFQNVFIMVFRQYKINYHAQNAKIWRRNVECHDLTFCMQRVMLR